jgi:hypothetical protein
VFFNLTNEGSSTSIGHMQGEVLVADERQFVQGTLSSNGNQINWSNGTFWARCNNGGGGGVAAEGAGRLSMGRAIEVAITRRRATSPSGERI